MDIVSRAKNMLMSPKAEWPVVAGESDSVGGVYMGYVIPVSAIPPIATLIGMVAFLHMGFGPALTVAIVSYILGLIGVFVVAWVAGKLAGMFGGTDSMEAGVKLVAFGSTASWVGGIFHIIPALGILSLLAAIYGIYIFYTGVTPVMGVPSGRVIGYLIALIVAVIVVFIVIGAIVAAVVGGSMMGMGMM